jgi:hypothetical protein
MKGWIFNQSFRSEFEVHNEVGIVEYLGLHKDEELAFVVLSVVVEYCCM